MIPPTIRRLTELRRLLPVLAAVLLVVAVRLPMWQIVMRAPQYPNEDLIVTLYAHPELGGDFQEVQALNQYVGFYYPDPVYVDPNYAVHEAAIATPEWVLGPVVFAIIAALGVFVALAPTERKLKLGLTGQLVGTLAVFTGMFAIIQYRLHQAGHALDPNAPLRGVEPFTPPLLGSYEVANISGDAWFAAGGYLTLVALALLVVAFALRDSDATVSETPRLLGDAARRVRIAASNGTDRLPGVN